MHTACCIFSQTVEIAGLLNPEGEIECSREKREETTEKAKEDKLKDMISVQFQILACAGYNVSVYMCFSDGGEGVH